MEILSFFFNSVGSVFAIDFGEGLSYTEWIALTVTIVSVLTAIVEFTQLRNQLVSCNLALRDLQNVLTWWDSLSLVRRRTPLVKQQIVSTTERAFISIVDAHTTAASNSQTSVEKALNDKI